jgi:hypothetical protein
VRDALTYSFMCRVAYDDVMCGDNAPVVTTGMATLSRFLTSCLKPHELPQTSLRETERQISLSKVPNNSTVSTDSRREQNLRWNTKVVSYSPPIMINCFIDCRVFSLCMFILAHCLLIWHVTASCLLATTHLDFLTSVTT